MFSESVYPPSRNPVTSCRNDLIAVCWAHTNQSIDMCTLSLCSRDRVSLQELLCFFFPNCQTSHYFVWLYTWMPQSSPTLVCFFLGSISNFFLIYFWWFLTFLQTLKSLTADLSPDVFKLTWKAFYKNNMLEFEHCWTTTVFVVTAALETCFENLPNEDSESPKQYIYTEFRLLDNLTMRSNQ